MRPTLSLLQKGLLLLAIPLIFQIVFVVMVFQIRSGSRTAADQVVLSTEITRIAEAPLISLYRAQSSMRGYLLTRDPAFEEQTESAITAARREIHEVRLLVRHPELAVRIEKIVADTDRYLAYISQVLLLADAGDWEGAQLQISQLVGVRLLSALEHDLREFVEAEDRLVTEKLAILDASWQRFNELLLLGALVLVSSTAFLGYVFRRGMTNRVHVLTENIHRLAERRVLAPAIGGADELTQLDRAFRDMAETLEIAAQKERTYLELLERRAEQLDTLNRELAQQNRENEMFVYSVSHDLRSPLVNLQGFSRELTAVTQDLAELLDSPDVPASIRQQARALLDGDIGESIHFIQQAVSRLGAIIDALLRLSRVGRVEYHPRTVDVAATVARVVDALKSSLAEHHARVEIGELPPAWGDPTAIEQIFANLLVNAVQYLDPSRPGLIEVGALEGGEGCQTYFVRDNGLGIPEAYREKIFAAFQRLYKDAGPGEGIGLAIVRRVVERLHGRIWIESQVNVGSTFYISIPSEPVADMDEAGSPLPEVPAGATWNLNSPIPAQGSTS